MIALSVYRLVWAHVPISAIACCLLLILSGMAACPPARAANIGIGGGARVEVPLRSMKDLRDQVLVRQRFDYSCGAAALATILRYGYGAKVTERNILSQLFDILSEDEKDISRKQGFSLLDLQKVAHALGYKAQGFRMAAADLPKLAGAVIVFIEPRGYKHFAVLKGIRDDRVFLADPSRGNIRLPAYRFLDSWADATGTGIIFVVEPKDGLPDHGNRLTVPSIGPVQPELLSVREMLAVGSTFTDAALPRR